jgi:colanic acid/amylovoran biosynthesis glycosyltransferase
VREASCGLGGGLLYVTSQTPFGAGEVWALREIASLVDAGARVRIVPRSVSGGVVHAIARDLLGHTLALSLAGGPALIALLHVAVSRPHRLLQYVRWCRARSLGWVDFARQLAVLPKALAAARMLRGDPPAHVHAHSTTTVATVAHVLASELAVPWSFMLHTASISTPAHQGLFETLLDSAIFMRTLSEDIVQQTATLLGDEVRNRLRVIRIGTHLPPAAELAGAPVDRKRLVIATPAMLVAHKGHRYAVEAARLLATDHAGEFVWRFFGEGPLQGQVAQQIEAAGVGHLVQLMGNVPNEQLLAAYRTGEIDLVVLPSAQVGNDREGIPHALMQAMAHEIPVVSSDSGSTAELIGDGAGVLVPQHDAAALAGAVGRLLRSSRDRRALGLSGRARVEAEFDERVLAARILDACLGPAKGAPLAGHDPNRTQVRETRHA